MKKMQIVLVLMMALAQVALPMPLFAAGYVCYNPAVDGGLTEDTDSGGNFRIWGVLGAPPSTGLWISRSTPIGRAFADSMQIRLWRAEEKSLYLHVRFGDEGYIWTVSGPMTHSQCEDQDHP